MKKVSIIVPVYNCQKYLEKCINSIVNQSYTNIELLLINDGSTDNSLDICNSFKEKYNNIIVINSVHEGVSKARNIGLDHITGDYIMFVDSDDWIDLDMVSTMMAIAEQYSDIDIIKCNSIKNYSNGREKIEFSCCLKDEIVLKNQFSDKIYNKFISTYELHTPCAQLIKTNLIKENNIIFNIGISYSEDFLFNLNLYTASTGVAFLNYYFYHYYYNLNSSTNIISVDKVKKRCEDIFFVYNELFFFLNKWNLLSEINISKVNNRIIKEINSIILGLYKSKEMLKRRVRIQCINDILGEFNISGMNVTSFSLLKNSRMFILEYFLVKHKVGIYDFICKSLFRFVYFCRLLLENVVVRIY